MNKIEQRFNSVNSLIREAELSANRNPNSVQLLAVSKTKPASNIESAYQTGQQHFGESYVQEAVTKQQELTDCDIVWHFIGPIQSNKTKLIAAHFDWVHSVDRLKIAKRLSEQRPLNSPPLNICLQVNISGEDSKSGVMLDQLPQLINEVNDLSNLKLRGVMAIPEPETDFTAQREPYKKLYQAVMQLNMPELDTFSFGMSGDLKAAIAEGSTVVRIGTALFGARSYPQKP
jgi:pyridoxal phosphate enzyme (YggS family)